MEDLVKSNLCTIVREPEIELAVSKSTVANYLKQISKSKKSEKSTLRSLLRIFSAMKTTHFPTALQRAKNEFYTTTVPVQLSRWTMMKFRGTWQSQNYTRRRSWWLFGGLQSLLSVTAFWIWVKPSRQVSIADISTRCIRY